MWVELIQGLNDKFEFKSPITAGQLDDAEAKLGVGLPEELRGLLLETDGVVEEYGVRLIWPLAQIVEENILFRETPGFRDLYMPFDHLLFFGDAGNGDQFAFPIHADGMIHRHDVFVWNHEDDSRNWVAPTLKTYLEWWSSGEIKQ